jgi:hypothetical protein
MRPDPLTRLLFLVYCLEAGIFLCWAPWTGFWQRTFVSFSWPRLGMLMLDPWVRGAVTGFGLVHLVWAVHDLETLLSWRSRRERAGG